MQLNTSTLSPLKSPVIIDLGKLPTGKFVDSEKPPVPSPSNIDTVLSRATTVAKSSRLSPLKSPVVIAHEPLKLAEKAVNPEKAPAPIGL